MLQWITKQAVSVVITITTMFVPQERYQGELDNLQGMAERVAEADLHGWTFHQEGAAGTDLTHSWFTYPSSSDTLPWLVCLHGFNTDGRVFVHLKSLSDSYRLVAYNLPEKTSRYTGRMDDFVPILDGFLRQLGADTVALVGNSVGGMIALHYAASPHTAHIRRLILLSTTVFGSSPKDAKEIREAADRLLPYPDYKLYYLVAKGRSFMRLFRDTELGEGTPAEAIPIKHIEWYRQVLRALYNYNAVVLAQRVHIPVLAMHGADDHLIPAERARAIRYLVPGAVFECVEGVGHTLVYERADLVARRIRESEPLSPNSIAVAGTQDSLRAGRRSKTPEN